eukprot:TRINITY_DN12167_c0_g1_i1.p1 TRINITY_DN12167_c0_g1~~TRINITY_DN12167_c0_g1_i1.p1  ORF type:complete len:1595 (-),score=481.25 TRINITY_DN12167_c0_g1_i1:91-4875(-)
MEMILTKLFGKYLSMFVKNFQKEQLNVRIFRGEGGLKNLELDVDVINELVGMPTLPLKRITIGTLRARAAVTRLRHEPVIVFIEDVVVELEEPLTTSNLQHGVTDELVAKIKKKVKPKKYGFSDKIGDGMRMEINRVSVFIRSRGRYRTVERDGIWVPPMMVVNIQQISTYTTNEDWEEVDLTKALPKYHKAVPIIKVYKVSKCYGTTVRVRDVRGNESILVDNVPSTVKIEIQKKAFGGMPTSIFLDVFMDAMKMHLNEIDLRRTMHCMDGLVHCILRNDPIEEVAIDSSLLQRVEAEEREKMSKLTRSDSESIFDGLEDIDEEGTEAASDVDFDDYVMISSASELGTKLHPHISFNVHVRSSTIDLVPSNVKDHVEDGITGWRMYTGDMLLSILKPDYVPLQDTYIQFGAPYVHMSSIGYGSHNPPITLMKMKEVDISSDSGLDVWPAFHPWTADRVKSQRDVDDVVRAKVYFHWPFPEAPAIGWMVEMRAMPMLMIVDYVQMMHLTTFMLHSVPDLRPPPEDIPYIEYPTWPTTGYTGRIEALSNTIRFPSLSGSVQEINLDIAKSSIVIDGDLPPASWWNDRQWLSSQFEKQKFHTVLPWHPSDPNVPTDQWHCMKYRGSSIARDISLSIVTGGRNPMTKTIIAPFTSCMMFGVISSEQMKDLEDAIQALVVADMTTMNIEMDQIILLSLLRFVRPLRDVDWNTGALLKKVPSISADDVNLLSRLGKQFLPLVAYSHVPSVNVNISCPIPEPWKPSRYRHEDAILSFKTGIIQSLLTTEPLVVFKSEIANMLVKYGNPNLEEEVKLLHCPVIATRAYTSGFPRHLSIQTHIPSLVGDLSIEPLVSLIHLIALPTSHCPTVPYDVMCAMVRGSPSSSLELNPSTEKPTLDRLEPIHREMVKALLDTVLEHVHKIDMESVAEKIEFRILPSLKPSSRSMARTALSIQSAVTKACIERNGRFNVESVSNGVKTSLNDKTISHVPLTRLHTDGSWKEWNGEIGLEVDPTTALIQFEQIPPIFHLIQNIIGRWEDTITSLKKHDSRFLFDERPASLDDAVEVLKHARGSVSSLRADIQGTADLWSDTRKKLPVLMHALQEMEQSMEEAVQDKVRTLTKLSLLQIPQDSVPGMQKSKAADAMSYKDQSIPVTYLSHLFVLQGTKKKKRNFFVLKGHILYGFHSQRDYFVRGSPATTVVNLSGCRVRRGLLANVMTVEESVLVEEMGEDDDDDDAQKKNRIPFYIRRKDEMSGEMRIQFYALSVDDAEKWTDLLNAAQQSAGQKEDVVSYTSSSLDVGGNGGGKSDDSGLITPHRDDLLDSDDWRNDLRDMMYNVNAISNKFDAISGELQTLGSEYEDAIDISQCARLKVPGADLDEEMSHERLLHVSLRGTQGGLISVSIRPSEDLQTEMHEQELKERFVFKDLSEKREAEAAIYRQRCDDLDRELKKTRESMLQERKRHEGERNGLFEHIKRMNERITDLEKEKKVAELRGAARRWLGSSVVEMQRAAQHFVMELESKEELLGHMQMEKKVLVDRLREVDGNLQDALQRISLLEERGGAPEFYHREMEAMKSDVHRERIQREKLEKELEAMRRSR